MNKRICILTSVHPAFDVRIFYKEAETLVKAGYNVILIAQHNKNETIDGIRIIALPKPRNRFCRIFFLTRKTYKLALQQKADVYHFHDPELLPWMVRLKKRTRARVIYDVHEDYKIDILSKYWLPKYLRKPIANIFNFFEKKLSKETDFIITASEDVKEEFKRINSNTELIKNFPILDNFKNIKKEKVRGESFNIIYAGGLTEMRGITQIIEAMQYLPNNVKLKLLGEFSPQSYEKNVRSLKGFKKVDYIGKIDFRKVPSHYAQADVGIICLWPELDYINSLPTKLFEYMAAGLPVVTSNFPLWKEIIEGNDCGICVNPLEPKEIARVIEYLIEHPEEAKKMGENGRKAVLEKYNWEKESEKLLKVYEELSKK